MKQIFKQAYYFPEFNQSTQILKQEKKIVHDKKLNIQIYPFVFGSDAVVDGFFFDACDVVGDGVVVAVDVLVVVDVVAGAVADLVVCVDCVVVVLTVDVMQMLS